MRSVAMVSGASVQKCILNVLSVVLLAFAPLLGCLPSFGQGNAGRILGAVTDQTGGAVSGATVTVVDTARGTSRTLTTNESGEYNAPNLLPGTYSAMQVQGLKASSGISTATPRISPPSMAG